MTGAHSHPFFPRGDIDDLDFGDLGEDQIEESRKFVKRILAHEIFLEETGKSPYIEQSLENVHVSQCFTCRKMALWVGDKLVEPSKKAGAAPNLDIEEHIRVDIEEARSILNISPRGAAALLRLALQKLCVQLGESGKNIDTDIKNLVAKGLDPHLQKAFDVVRVVGNEAVHPGSLDLQDDADTAAELINLINIVAQVMISNKKLINEMYSRLPAAKLVGIEARDRKSSGQK
jgi:hypothetical protein